MKCIVVALSLAISLVVATSASAQSLGTFRWQLQPYGSVLTLNVTQQGGIYLLDGFEAQCGANPSLPASGIAVPQANGSVILGVTTINADGRGLHTRATINTQNFNGFWVDNAGNTNASTQPFAFNPTAPCPLGPRTGPITPDPAPGDAATVQALTDQIAALTARLSALEAARK